MCEFVVSTSIDRAAQTLIPNAALERAIASLGHTGATVGPAVGARIASLGSEPARLELDLVVRFLAKLVDPQSRLLVELGTVELVAELLLDGLVVFLLAVFEL